MKTIEIQIENCANCPVENESLCNLYIALDDYDSGDIDWEHIPPTWCPLRTTNVILKLGVEE